MAKRKDFEAFLKNIEPSESTVSYISSVQNNLRLFLQTSENYKDIHVDTFLSGSYAKHTSIRPVKNDRKRDVDIVVVTGYSSSKNSIDVLVELYDVLKETRDYHSSQIQSHSIGIEMGQISVDVVPVIADRNDNELYYIGESSSGRWIATDPKGHKCWSTLVNQNNDGKYKPLVKIFKWWRRVNCPEGVKFPKGIVLEKIIADNFGDPEASIEDCLIDTMGKIVSAYKEEYTDKMRLPEIMDPSEKTKGNNLLEGYSLNDFKMFINLLDEHIKLLDNEGTDNEVWRKILGLEFPKASSPRSNYNLLVCQMASHRQRMLWPFSRGGYVFLGVRVSNSLGRQIFYENNGAPLEKGCSLWFKAYTGVKPPFVVVWQVTNTGEEAKRDGCLRGGFEQSNDGALGRKEVTRYTGSHSVQCFILKDGICVAKSRDFIINIV